VSFFEKDNDYKKLSELLRSSSVIIDGVLGTGIKLPLRGEIAKVLAFVKEHCEKSTHKVHVVAVDCPSGVNCDTGEAAPEAIPADMTVTMAGVKRGLIIFPAANLTGELRTASIGQIENLGEYKQNKKLVLTEDLIRLYLPKRSKDSHKGTFGTAFIIAGSVNYTGAALLAGLAAYRVGVGLVTMAIPAPLHAALSGQFPEATWILLPSEMGVISADAAHIVQQNVNRGTALLIGPGFGLEDTTRDFLFKLFTQSQSGNKGDFGFIQSEKISDRSKRLPVPVVVDADGLKLLSKIKRWWELIPSLAVLTPHPGEMAVLADLPVEEIQKDRIEIAKNIQQMGSCRIKRCVYSYF
jgi:NAD(P)H-hydrate epimerase